MKVAAFRTILAAAEGLYRDGGNETAAQALGLLARLLSVRDAMTVAALATRLAGVPPTATSDELHGGGGSAIPGTVADARALLASLRALCDAAGAKGAAKDIEALSASLERHAASPLDAFCVNAEAWLIQPAMKSKGPSKATATKGGTPNEEAVALHLAALRNAGIDRAAFEAALAALKADKSVKSAAVAEIARRYANTVTKYKSIAAAHTDIASAFTQRARFASKVG